MPFQVSEQGIRVRRCEVCGKLTSKPLAYKTCCMNKPVYFCSTSCLRKWVAEWVKNQDQVMKGDRRLRRMNL